MDNTARPLEGLSVVELSSTVPSALVGQLLGDFGAEVIHVEPPGGNPLRAQPAFPAWYRGKQSIALDLTNRGDVGVALDLLADADVAIESFRPGVADRLGVGYDDISDRSPQLVYASISGFPPTGPGADLPGYEALVMAKVGGFHAFAPSVARPGPAFAAVPYCSFSAAQTTLHGILAALYERDRSGRGQRVASSLLEAVASLDPWNWMLHVVRSRFPDAFSGAANFEDGVPNTPFAYMLLVALTADGHWLQFSQVQPHLFRALMRALDLEWMYDDPRWATVPVLASPEQRLELWELMLTRVKDRSLADWQKVFESDHDVWAEVFRRGHGLLEHPQMVHDGLVVEIEDRTLGPVRQPGPMVRLSATPGRADRPAPFPDEHGPDLRQRGARPGQPALPGVDGAIERPSSLPLEGVTILELGTFYAGPFGATVLTDFGARVIKAEELDGDPMRTMLPFPEAGGARVLQGKESVAVDIGSEDGREIVYALARRCDVVLQTFRAGVAERLRLDAATLRAVNPNLVYVNAPGYGVDGPCGDRPAYAPTIGAGAGVARRNAGETVEERADLDLEEIKDNSIRLTSTNNIAFAQTDGLSALGVATALLLGLVARQRGAGGQVAATSMLSTVAHALSEEMIDHPGRPDVVGTDQGMYGFGPLYRLYEAAEGWVFLAAPRPKEFERLAAALEGEAELAGDARFATAEARSVNAAALVDVLTAVFARRPASAWELELGAAGVGCVEVATDMPEGIFLGELGRASGILVDVVHPVFDEYPRLAPMVRFSRSRTAAGVGCLCGAHTDAVLEELGYSRERIADLRARGVVAG